MPTGKGMKSKLTFIQLANACIHIVLLMNAVSNLCGSKGNFSISIIIWNLSLVSS